MITEAEIKLLRANQRFLASEMKRRAIEIDVFDWNNEVLLARLGRHVELFLDIDSSCMPFAASSISGSKSLTKKILTAAGVRVPAGEACSSNEIDRAIAVARQLDFPVVIKPSFGTQGECVFTCIEGVFEARLALQSIAEIRGDVEILVEEQFVGEEYRVFVTRSGEYAVIHRDPAFVVGDGRHTIHQLAVMESYRRMNPRCNCLCEIVLDDEVRRFLKKRGRSLDAVPSADEKVYLRGSSNLKMGGFAEDVTDFVHPSVIEICRRAVSAIPGLPYGGVDFMCKDIRAMQDNQSYRVLEINSLPGIGMHMAPGKGEPRNVAAMILDIVFPESKY